MHSIGAAAFSRVALENSMLSTIQLDRGLSAVESSHNVMADGTRFALNAEGRVIHASYKSGAAVRRHAYYTVVRSSAGSHWFINKYGHVMPLD